MIYIDRVVSRELWVVSWIDGGSMHNSYLAAYMCIISTAQHASPNVIGQNEPFLAQLTTPSNFDIITSGKFCGGGWCPTEAPSCLARASPVNLPAWSAILLHNTMKDLRRPNYGLEIIVREDLVVLESYKKLFPGGQWVGCCSLIHWLNSPPR